MSVNRKEETLPVAVDKASGLFRFIRPDGSMSEGQFTHPQMAVAALEKEIADKETEEREEDQHANYSQPSGEAQQEPPAGNTEQKEATPETETTPL